MIESLSILLNFLFVIANISDEAGQLLFLIFVIALLVTLEGDDENVDALIQFCLKSA